MRTLPRAASGALLSKVKSHRAQLVKPTLTNNDKVDVSIRPIEGPNREREREREKPRNLVPLCPFVRARLLPRAQLSSVISHLRLAREHATMAPPNIYFFPNGPTVSLNGHDNLVNRDNGAGPSNDFHYRAKLRGSGMHYLLSTLSAPLPWLLTPCLGSRSNFLISEMSKRLSPLWNSWKR